MLKKKKLFIIFVIFIVLSCLYGIEYFLLRCNHSTNSFCSCPYGAQKVSGGVVCIKSPCPDTIYYSCQYNECKVNSDCSAGKLCNGSGKCVK